MLPAAGECMLEWDGEGKAPVPLLKDMFASERRKAKVLNFSIAYGKTAHGLGKDWKVSLEEAQNTVNRWYADRPEVRGRSHAMWEFKLLHLHIPFIMHPRGRSKLWHSLQQHAIFMHGFCSHRPTVKPSIKQAGKESASIRSQTFFNGFQCLLSSCLRGRCFA